MDLISLESTPATTNNALDWSPLTTSCFAPNLANLPAKLLAVPPLLLPQIPHLSVNPVYPAIQSVYLEIHSFKVGFSLAR